MGKQQDKLCVCYVLRRTVLLALIFTTSAALLLLISYVGDGDQLKQEKHSQIKQDIEIPLGHTSKKLKAPPTLCPKTLLKVKKIFRKFKKISCARLFIDYLQCHAHL